MAESPNIFHDVIFAASAFIPVWLPLLATAIFWRSIDKKLFYLVGGIFAAGGIQHFFSFMHLWQIAQGTSLFIESGSWNDLAVQTMILAVPGFVLTSAYLYWSMKLLSKNRPNSQFDTDAQTRRST